MSRPLAFCILEQKASAGKKERHEKPTVDRRHLALCRGGPGSCPGVRTYRWLKRGLNKILGRRRNGS